MFDLDQGPQLATMTMLMQGQRDGEEAAELPGRPSQPYGAGAPCLFGKGVAVSATLELHSSEALTNHARRRPSMR